MRSLAEQYARQRAWRDGETALALLPPLSGATVLDLGCGIGDGAAALAARGARVVGVDCDEELLEAARARSIAGLELVAGDVRRLDELADVAVRQVDGIWASFVAAYLVDELEPVLAAWARRLRPGGWIALTEIDDLFGHEPLEPRTCAVLTAYADEALAAGRYDFRMGRKLRPALERTGLEVTVDTTLADQELASRGPASADVIAAWRDRFDRMALLRQRCGSAFEDLRDDFLRCLAHPAHRASARVVFCLGTRVA